MFIFTFRRNTLKMAENDYFPCVCAYDMRGGEREKYCASCIQKGQSAYLLASKEGVFTVVLESVGMTT